VKVLCHGSGQRGEKATITRGGADFDKPVFR